MVTMQQIAAKVGVSRNTVSKVLNGKGGVSRKLCNTILKTAADLGYSKLFPAAGETVAASDSRQSITVMVTNQKFSQDWMHILNSIAEELGKTNINLIYNYITDNQKARDYLKTVKLRGISGLIIINVYNQGIIDEIAETGLPAVYFDVPVHCTCDRAHGDIILFEGKESIYAVTSHMVSGGAGKLGFIGDIHYCRAIYDRWAGFLLALQEHEIAPDSRYNLTEGFASHFYDAGEVERALASLHSYPEAFVCANDVIASCTIRYFERKGYRVPDDIMVSGYDSSTELFMGCRQLTTVKANVPYLGRRLVRQLFDRINHPDRPFETILIQTEPCFRSTTRKRLS